MASQTQPSTAPQLDWPATLLAWLGRQLLLVPEAVLLLTLLCLHATIGPSPALITAGAGLVIWFAARMTLLYAARRSVESARYGRAEAMAHMAVKLYPLSADANALLGTVYLARGKPTAAVSALDRAVRYYPIQAGLHAALSAALLEDGRPHDALAEAAAALHIDPTCAPAYLHQAVAEDLLDASPDIIERHLRAGLEQPAAPADEAALSCALARILLRKGNVTEARLALTRAEGLLPMSQAPQRASLHYQIGEILHQSGDPEAAHTHFSASEALDPHGPYAADAWRAARS
jgi:tetratricopeptide (TPR) repeat protein